MEDTVFQMSSGDGESHQERLYFLLAQLQGMATQLPTRFQQRIPYELLSELAASLAQGHILDIVRTLTELQQATEKRLFQERLQDINKQNLEKQEMVARKAGSAELAAKEAQNKAERQQGDMRLVTQLDQKVSEQQVTLERAGVPGFYVTNNSTEIQVQMYLLEFIVRIGNKEYV